MKRWSRLAAAIAVCLVITVCKPFLAADAAEAKEIVLYIGSHTAIADGEQKQIDAEKPLLTPYLVGDKAFVPLRFVGEQYGAKITWDPNNHLASASLGEQTIWITPGKPDLQVKNGLISLTEPAELKDGSIFVPVRELSEALGFTVKYADRVIVISKGKQIRTPQEIYSVFSTPFKTGLAYTVYQNDSFLDGFDREDDAVAYAKQWAHSTVRLQDGTHIWDYESYMAKLQVHKTVYLSFDDGPSPYTSSVLDLLKKYGDKATFFMLAGHIQSYQEDVKQMVEEGEAVGLHGVTHDAKQIYRTPQTVVDEMEACNKVLEKVTGKRTSIMRVPYGSKPYMTEAYRNAVVKAGYHMWDWNVDSYDSRSNATTESIVKETIQQVNKNGAGAVILFHDTKKQTLDALPQILDYLHANGYISKPITEDMTPVNFWNDKR